MHRVETGVLNLIHVRSFLIMAEARSLRAAAAALGLSPSTVLEHLRQLEAGLGAVLVRRQAGSGRLTPAGARFLPLARGMVATVQRAAEHIRNPFLAIAASSNIGTYLLPARLTAFEHQTGNEARLWIGTNMEAVARLERGEADLAVVEWWQAIAGFEAMAWRAEPLKVIVGPDHRWAARASVAPAELADEVMLGGEPGTGTGRILRDALGPIATRLRYLDGWGSTEAVKRAVRAGRGISIVMASAIEDELRNGALVALDVRDTRLEKHLMIARAADLPETAPAARLAAALAEPSLR